MGKIASFRDLDVYQLGLREAKKVFLMTKIFQRKRGTLLPIKFDDHRELLMHCWLKRGRVEDISTRL